MESYRPTKLQQRHSSSLTHLLDRKSYIRISFACHFQFHQRFYLHLVGVLHTGAMIWEEFFQTSQVYITDLYQCRSSWSTKPRSLCLRHKFWSSKQMTSSLKICSINADFQPLAAVLSILSWNCSPGSWKAPVTRLFQNITIISSQCHRSFSQQRWEI